MILEDLELVLLVFVLNNNYFNYEMSITLGHNFFKIDNLFAPASTLLISQLFTALNLILIIKSAVFYAYLLIPAPCYC